MRSLVLVLLVGLTAEPLAPAPLTAQARERERDSTRVKSRSIYRVWVAGRDVTNRLEPLMQRRARLGITVSLDAKETDSLGAFVESVTPGGPAAKAGIRSGDIITKLEGKSLLSATGRSVESEESLPGVRLIELAAKLEPNDTIAIEYLRGEARRTASLVTGDEPIFGMADSMRGFFFKVPEGEDHILRVPGMRMEPLPEKMSMEPFWERSPGVGMFFGGGPLGELELAPLNPDLGAYFGATEGVLVIRAPANSSLGLKGGDVVLGVDGRRPSNPSSLIRILRSYDQGESFKLEILRQKKRETITGKLESPRER